MPKIQTFETSTGLVHYVIIPKAIVKLKRWKKGGVLEFREEKGQVFIEHQ